MSRHTIAWLPAHPAMGWVSMNRCWQALQKQEQQHSQKDLQFVCPLKLASVEQPAASSWRRNWARYIGYPSQAKHLESVDAVHVLDHSFAELLRWVKPSVKKIVTVHDLIPLIDSAELSPSQVQRFRKRMEWLRKADLILSVSDFTRQCLLEQLNLSPSRVRVLHNGVDAPSAKPGPWSVNQARPWMLLVGSSLRRKNLRIVPEVLRLLVAKGVTPTVVRIGSPLPPELQIAIRTVVGDERLVELGNVSDDVLESAYSSSDILFFPSTLEGFGLPVLEAMAHGCPVVCARSSSLPEVAGTAALLFDPESPQEAAAACSKVLTDAVERQRLNTLGQQRAAALSWERHWDQLCDIYREVLSA